MGLGSYLRDRRRRRTLADRPLEEGLWLRAVQDEPMTQGMGESELGRLREICTIMMSEKRFEFVGGLEPDARIALTICLQASIPVLNLGVDWYDDWQTFIVTPGAFDETKRHVDKAGVVHEWDEEISGQVLDLGPVILSWQDVQDSYADYQVVVHEMAHKLDMRDGFLNGTPPLPVSRRASWNRVFTAAYEGLIEMLESRRPTGRPPRRAFGAGPKRPRFAPLDSYAAESPEEFFAVACETFFGAPLVLQRRLPEIYEHLAAFFGQDPANR